MDTSLLEKLTHASTLERQHKTLFLNHDGNPAQPGDLIIQGADYDETKAALIGKVNQDDVNRVFVIADSNKKKAANVVLACKGNGGLLGIPSKMQIAKLDPLLQATPYKFANVYVTDTLDDAQIQQMSELAVDQTNLWGWGHLGRISSSNIARANFIANLYLAGELRDENFFQSKNFSAMV